MTRRLVAAVVAAALSACGGTGGGGAQPSSDHRASLAEHESPELASQLVGITGYSYADAPAGEVTELLERFHGPDGDFTEAIWAASFHGVVSDNPAENTARTASGGSELGFLALFLHRFAPPAGVETNESYFARGFDSSVGPARRLEIDGTAVFRFEDPSRVDSRFVYRWIRHGIEAHFDGADDTAMERWLELYLTAPAPSPAETPELEALLVPIDGFAYANAPNLDALERAVVEAFGDVAHSIHKLADEGGSVGSLVLVDPTVEMSLDDAVTAFAEASGFGIDPRDLTVIEGVPVASHDEQGVIFQMWVTDGVVAILVVETAEPEAIAAQLLRGWEQLDTAE